jgi:3-oxoacyl-(acyl-carrier-protein) synthase III
MNKYSRVFISGLRHHVPERMVTNDDIIARESLKMKSSWIEKNLGITERRWCAPEEAASDLAVAASKELVAGFAGPLFLSTISPDYFTPSTSAMIKKKLALTCKDPAFDLSAACAGWIFALEAAAVRLDAGRDAEALVLASEVRSKFLNPRDRRTAFLFGDGAVAARLTATKPTAKYFELQWTHLSSIPVEDMEIFVPGGGSVAPFTASSLETDEQYIRMVDGNAIREATQTRLLEEIAGVLGGKADLSGHDLVLFHQGNKNLILTVLGLMGATAEKTFTTFETYGNSSSASVGVTLSEALKQGKLNDGACILLITFGAGQHMGMAQLVWHE